MSEWPFIQAAQSRLRSAVHFAKIRPQHTADLQHLRRSIGEFAAVSVPTPTQAWLASFPSALLRSKGCSRLYVSDSEGDLKCLLVAHIGQLWALCHGMMRLWSQCCPLPRTALQLTTLWYRLSRPIDRNSAEGNCQGRRQFPPAAGQTGQSSIDVACLIHDNDPLAVSFARDDDGNNAAECTYPSIH